MNKQCVSFMQHAIELAERGEGLVEPNPMVGCVLVRDHVVIGQGWHRKFGGDHAEVSALKDACLLYTSPSPRDQRGSRMPSSA